jgi:predicted ATPase/DNA-binding winged helix-turn-helix (wHTH) protein
MSARYSFGPYTFNGEAGDLGRETRIVRLPRRQRVLLTELVRKAGADIPASALIAAVWPHTGASDGSLRAQIAALRKQLGDHSETPAYIATTPGGYRFICPVQEQQVLEPDHSAPESRYPALIGRDTELDVLEDAFGAHRLVTITGAGGIGKTTLAFAAARRHATLFPMGVTLVDLGAARDSEAIHSALLAAQGRKATVRQAAHTFAHLAGHGRCLTVFDCCEALLPDVAAASRSLMAANPELVILCTSREPLGVPGEWVLKLNPMAVPCDEPTDACTALGYAAIQLFELRTRASYEDFAVDDGNAATVASICRHLDGIPLAIEIAAAMVDALGLANLLRRLEQGSNMLDLRRRPMDPRHESLRTALDWSFALLEPDQRAVLLSLSTFERPFGLMAAIAVAGVSAAVGAAAIRDLVGKSLLVADTDTAEVSYRLLDITRAYLRDKWKETGEAASARRRHAQHMLAFGNEAFAQLSRLEPSAWSARYGSRLDDLTTAMEWSAQSEETLQLASSLAIASGPLYFRMSRPQEFQAAGKCVVTAVDAARDFPESRKLELNVAVGRMIWTISWPAADEQPLAEAVHAAEATHQTDLLIEAIRNAWREAVLRGDYAAGVAHSDRALAIAASHNDPALTIDCERMATTSWAFSGSLALARASGQRCVDSTGRFPNSDRYMALDECQDKATLAFVLLNLGLFEQARSLWDDIQVRAEQVGHALSMLYVSCGRFLLEIWADDTAAARVEVERMRVLLRQEPHPYWQAWVDAFDLILKVYGRVGSSSELPAETSNICGLARDYLLVSCPASVTSRDVALVRTGSPSWCAPGILRAHALNILAVGNGDRSEALATLREAREMARSTGALAWELRIAITMAEVADDQDSQSAKEHLAEVVSRCLEDAKIGDLVSARRILSQELAEA